MEIEQCSNSNGGKEEEDLWPMKEPNEGFMYYLGVFYYLVKRKKKWKERIVDGFEKLREEEKLRG